MPACERAGITCATAHWHASLRLRLAAGVWEGLVIFALAKSAVLWMPLGQVGPPVVHSSLAPADFVTHYGAVWLATFIAAQSVLRIAFPRWRFRGGQWL